MERENLLGSAAQEAQEPLLRDDAELVRSAEALLQLYPAGKLAPQDIGSQAREVIEAFVARAKAQAAQEPVKLRFPTMLRKMWSGGDVQEWLDRQGPLYTAFGQQECAGCRDMAAEFSALRAGKNFCGACGDGCEQCRVEAESPPAAAAMEFRYQVRYLAGETVEERWWQDSSKQRAEWCAEANVQQLAQGLPAKWEIRAFHIAQTAITQEGSYHA